MSAGQRADGRGPGSPAVAEDAEVVFPDIGCDPVVGLRTHVGAVVVLQEHVVQRRAVGAQVEIESKV